MARLLRVACVWAAVVVALVGTSLPSSAAEEIGLSPDGQSWAPQLPGELFDSSVAWVPGDVRSSTFFVRNESDDAATLAVGMDLGAGSSQPGADLIVEARVGGGSWDVLDPAGARATMPDPLAPREFVSIEIRATFSAGAGDNTQGVLFTPSFTVILEGEVAPTPTPTASSSATPSPTDSPSTSRPPSGTPAPSEPTSPVPAESQSTPVLTGASADGSDGGLAITGANVNASWVVAAAVAIVAGLALALRSRKDARS